MGKRGGGRVLRASPPRPVGTVPGSQYVTADTTGIKVGLITRVDEINLKADIKVLTGGGDRYEIDLTQGLAGPRSFWGGVPEVNSIVILGYRKVGRLTIATILGYLPTGNRSGLRFDPFSPIDPADLDPADLNAVQQRYGKTVRYKRLKLRPGQCGGMSADGSEFVLSRDVQMVNRAGDMLELRDADRTLAMQSIHKVESLAGVRHYTGPVRRADLWLPGDIIKDGTFNAKDPADGYWGKDELQATGPGNTAGADGKFADTTGKLNGVINDPVNRPPVTYTNGRRTFYPCTFPAVSIEEEDGAGARVYTECRTEVFHTTDMAQEVISEIDGFTMDRRDPYIEHVLGTVVGNDAMMSTHGIRSYGKILAPVLFEDFWQQDGKRLKLDEVSRSPVEPDLEVDTMAGAYLLRIRPPRKTSDNEFAVCVSKQGKLFANIPGSSVERYPSGTKNVSAELGLGGGVKVMMGMTAPEKLSLHLTAEGGLYLDLGQDAVGNSLTIRHHGAIKYVHASTPNDEDAANSEEVDGDKELGINGSLHETIEGTHEQVVSGQSSLKADRVTVNAHSGHTINAGELNTLVSGKTQFNYAQVVTETIVTGGRSSTILAGGELKTVAAGAVVETIGGGAKTTTVAGGAYTLSVAGGAVSMTTGAGAVALSTGAGAMSIAAGGGAISLAAGLAINLAATTLASLVAPQILLGGPAAVLGVCRGLPMMGPGQPSLDWITGKPLMGSLLVRSI